MFLSDLLVLSDYISAFFHIIAILMTCHGAGGSDDIPMAVRSRE